MLMVSGLEVMRLVQELVVFEIVADAVPPVTLATLDPFVVHPVAFNAMAVDSALPPFVVSGGENVRDPVRLEHATPPVASVTVVVVVAGAAFGLEPHAVANRAISPSGTRSENLHMRILDMACSPLVPSAGPLRSTHPDGSCLCPACQRTRPGEGRVCAARCDLDPHSGACPGLAGVGQGARHRR